MRYFPVFLDLEGCEVLVAGGGEQAVQKVRLLIRTGARIIVVAPDFAPELIALGVEGRIRLEPRAFETGDVAGKVLAYAATGSAGGNARVAEAARAAGIPVNVVDKPEQSTFITPAIVDRDPVVIAIGTEGAAPVLAREIKSRLEAILPSRFGRIAEAARALRERAAREIPILSCGAVSGSGSSPGLSGRRRWRATRPEWPRPPTRRLPSQPTRSSRRAASRSSAAGRGTPTC